MAPSASNAYTTSFCAATKSIPGLPVDGEIRNVQRLRLNVTFGDGKLEQLAKLIFVDVRRNQNGFAGIGAGTPPVVMPVVTATPVDC